MEPTARRKVRRNASGSRGPSRQSVAAPAAKASASGFPCAARVAGGSITVSERSSGKRAAASSETTPP